MAAAAVLIAIAGVTLAGLAVALVLSWQAERQAEYRGEHRIPRRSRHKVAARG